MFDIVVYRAALIANEYANPFIQMSVVPPTGYTPLHDPHVYLYISYLAYISFCTCKYIFPCFPH